MILKSHDIFPTPILTGSNALTKEQLDDIIEFVENLPNEHLGQHILFGSEDKAKTTFWKTKDILSVIEDKIDSCKNIKKDLQRALESYVLNYGIRPCQISHSWAVKQKRGARTAKHLHAMPAAVSGVLYIRKGFGGETVLSSPNPYIDLIPRKDEHSHISNITTITKYTISISKIPANDGDFILFPALLHHESLEHNHDDDRIVIAFNCELKN